MVQGNGKRKAYKPRGENMLTATDLFLMVRFNAVKIHNWWMTKGKGPGSKGGLKLLRR